ncbi:uncharacterized protein LOC107037142 [Diachasma alloeum]|uniref:uncharacterized protein LOC107037142 n=1 Tax=Diachasma alloeum TaxID=454923 RepID=UPI0007384D1E|nr:uncharacterized protein LOC107037142 [Diachasma alloeum]
MPGSTSLTDDSVNLNMEELTNLRRRRGFIQAAITNFTSIVETYTTTPENNSKPYRLQAALQRLKDRFMTFPEIQDRLEELDEEETPKRFKLEDSYDKAVGDALELLEPHQPPSIASSQLQSSPPAPPAIINNFPHQPRLPELKIPEFDGSIENFYSFWDSFRTQIHDCSLLKTTQKFGYLRGLLKGSAGAAIGSLGTTEANYATAIDILKKKFDCKKKILRRHWSIMRDYPSLQRGALGQLADVMNQNIQALETLGQDVTSWDLPLIDLITQKLAPETVWQWELRTQGNELPTYKQLLDFIEARATCHDTRTTALRSYPPTSSETSSSDKKKEKKLRRQAFVTASVGPSASTPATSASAGSSYVLHCGTVHRHISKCPLFKGLTPEQRYSKTKGAGLCINCLKPGHERSVCISSVDCSICKDRHHTLLHFNTGEKSTPTQS